MARETKGSGDKGFPVLDSRTSCLHVCSRDVSIYCMGESWCLLLLLKISLFQTANQKKSVQNFHVKAEQEGGPTTRMFAPMPHIALGSHRNTCYAALLSNHWVCSNTPDKSVNRLSSLQKDENNGQARNMAIL